MGCSLSKSTLKKRKEISSLQQTANYDIEDKCKLIIEYWFRESVSSDISINNIVQMITAFLQIYEQFFEYKCHGGNNITITNDGQLLICNYEYGYKAIGTVITKAGCNYHWALKLVEMKYDMYIGIRDNNATRDGYTYAWWSFGALRQRIAGEYKGKYADMKGKYSNNKGYRKDDTVHIWLNLSNDKREILFGRNDKHFGKAFDVKSTEYRLAILIYGNAKIEIVAFEVTK